LPIVSERRPNVTLETEQNLAERDRPVIAVVGAGLMGHGIGQEFARHGYPVRLYDLTDAILLAARRRIECSLERFATAGLLDSTAAVETLSRLSFSTDLAETLSDADVVIEAVSESLPLKQELFARLDRLCPPHTILASNTSSFMPSLLAPSTTRPDKVIIAHYFNPPFLLPAVEVVPGPQTSEATIQTIVQLLQSAGKTPILLRKEAPGFVANRLQAALYREALAIVQQGIASAEEVDAVVRNGFGRRLAAAGPFQIGDLAGWDVWRAIAEQLMPDINSRAEIPALLQERVDRGEFGVKSGQGFYTWDAPAEAEVRGRIASTLLHLSQNDPRPAGDLNT
jgi:3-hydroxybutyryl-CoA dehydrogenase